MAWFIPFIPYAVAAVGTVYQGVQQDQEAKEQQAQAVEEGNAARRAANAEEEAQRRQAAMIAGGNRARASQSGFDANEGSLAALQVKTVGEMELDALTTRYRGELQAIGADREAQAYGQARRRNRSQTALNAFSTLYGGQVKLNYGAATRINQPMVG